MASSDMSERLIVALSALLLLAACEDDKPHWENLCVRDHTDMIMMPTFINGTTYLMPQFYTTCDARQTTCVIPSGWKGEKTCPPIKEENVRNEK